VRLRGGWSSSGCPSCRTRRCAAWTPQAPSRTGSARPRPARGGDGEARAGRGCEVFSLERAQRSGMLALSRSLARTFCSRMTPKAWAVAAAWQVEAAGARVLTGRGGRRDICGRGERVVGQVMRCMSRHGLYVIENLRELRSRCKARPQPPPAALACVASRRACRLCRARARARVRVRQATVSAARPWGETVLCGPANHAGMGHRLNARRAQRARGGRTHVGVVEAIWRMRPAPMRPCDSSWHTNRMGAWMGSGHSGSRARATDGRHPGAVELAHYGAWVHGSTPEHVAGGCWRGGGRGGRCGTSGAWAWRWTLRSRCAHRSAPHPHTASHHTTAHHGAGQVVGARTCGGRLARGDAS
jgi:hypothetical protein